MLLFRLFDSEYINHQVILIYNIGMANTWFYRSHVLTIISTMKLCEILTNKYNIHMTCEKWEDNDCVSWGRGFFNSYYTLGSNSLTPELSLSSNSWQTILLYREWCVNLTFPQNQFTNENASMSATSRIMLSWSFICEVYIG